MNLEKYAINEEEQEIDNLEEYNLSIAEIEEKLFLFKPKSFLIDFSIHSERYCLNNEEDLSEENKTYKFEKKMKFFETQHFVCKKCCSLPVIESISKDEININCECNNPTINLSFKNGKENINNYIMNEQEIIESKKENLIVNSFICNKHIKNYKYFCNKCRKNLCRKCLKNENHIENHSENDLIVFDFLSKELNSKIEDIKKILNEDIFYKFNFNDNKIGYRELVMIIINDYYKYQNYNIIKSIENIHTFEISSYLKQVNLIINYIINEYLKKFNDKDGKNLDNDFCREYFHLDSKLEYKENRSDTSYCFFICVHNSIFISNGFFYKINVNHIFVLSNVKRKSKRLDDK